MRINRPWPRRRPGGVLVFLLAALTGCGTPTAKPGYTPPVEDKLREVWAMYKAHVDARKRPPARLADLDPYEPANLNGYADLRDGGLVILWGGAVPSAGAGARVLAYEKDAPQQGGYVLFQDGTVKHLSAAEFQAAPKAGPG
jgi:hypothetical protein